MRKICLTCLLIFLPFLKSYKYTNDYLLNDFFNSSELLFIKENNISLSDIDPFLEYSSFNIFRYFEYQELVTNKNYSILEAINYINNPNYYNFYYSPKESIYKNTNTMLVNKCFFLDSSFTPSNLVYLKNTNLSYIKRENEEMMIKKDILNSYQNLYTDALKNGFQLYIFSSYRDYNKQYHLYYNVNNQNDEYVARPGFSEHQSGYALDISTLNHGLTNNFQYSKEYKWLIENSYKYGFILRYPEEKENITGYKYEPWHFRFVGEELAKFLYTNNLTLEEYILKYLEIK